MSVGGRLRVLALVVLCALGLAWLTLRPTLTVQTTPSMLSRIPVGSLVVAVRTSWSAIRPGEILVFREPGTKDVRVAHYVLALHGSYLTTHSELTHAADAWEVLPKDVSGRAVAVIPGLGWAWADPMVWLALVAGLALAVALPRRGQRLGALAAGLSAAGVAWLRTRPLVGLFPIAEPTIRHHAELIGVSTGMLREEVRLADSLGAAVTHVAQGHLVHLAVRAHDGQHVAWRASVSLAAWEWMLVVLTLLTPALVGAAIARGILRAGKAGRPAEPAVPDFEPAQLP